MIAHDQAVNVFQYPFLLLRAHILLEMKETKEESLRAYLKLSSCEHIFISSLFLYYVLTLLMTG